MLDKPEQGLDLLQEAMTQLGLTPGKDFHVVLNCAGHETFDYEKGKYEVMAGQAKTPEDLTEFWSDLLSRYPFIIGLIDPIRKEEREAWMKLCEQLTDKCYVMGDAAYHRPGRLKDEELTDDFKTSGIVLKLEQMNTVSDVLKVIKKMEDADNQIIIGASSAETSDTLLADLAVGVNAKFFKIGAPCRGERVAKLNRLLVIETELETNCELDVWQPHTFTLIKPPTPPPENEDGEGAEEEEGKNQD